MMNKTQKDKETIIIHNPLGFTVLAVEEGNRIKFSIYEITGYNVTENGKIPFYGKDEITDVNDIRLEPVIRGCVYCNHTSDWVVGSRSRFRFTGRDLLDSVSKILTVCFDYTKDNLATWDAEID